jgi:DNA-binding GntR family transcriptional regulator
LEEFVPAVPTRQPLWQTIVETMRRAIIVGDLVAGTHLEEQALANKFGVSRATVLRALTQLKHEGLIQSEPWQGAFFTGITEDDVHHIYECRLLLEPFALNRAAERLDSAGFSQLQSLVDQMELRIREGGPGHMAEPDVQFHRTLINLSGNPRLLYSWEPHAGLIRTLLGITNEMSPRDPQWLVREHQVILDALAAGRRNEAEELLRTSLQSGEMVMRGIIRRTGRLQTPFADRA